MVALAFLGVFLIVGVSLAVWASAMAGRAGAARQRAAPALLYVHAALLAAASASLAVYVASDDGYRQDGTSRWEAYDAQAVTVVAVGLGAAVAVLAAFGARGRRAPGVAAGPLGIAVALLLGAAFFANSLN